jgi:2-dehydro-3-deoxyphosphogluconate aldolase/(4S)-4-hydroxy-2-oxoglutarate aldolase
MIGDAVGDRACAGGSMEDLIARLASARILPVATIGDPHRGRELVAALADGGIRALEVTLRSPGAIEVIRAVARTPGFLVGAGTVLTTDDVDMCVDAGVEFIVSPGLDDEIVTRALERGVTPLPGIATATELQRAARQGLGAVKFFPAGPLGGEPAIRALAAPFPGMRFMPSGGITAADAPRYLRNPAVFALGGSWMVTSELLAAGDFASIARLSAEAMYAANGAS